VWRFYRLNQRRGRNRSQRLGVGWWDGALMEVEMRSFIIGALFIAVGVLGYLYWDSEHNTIFKAPGIEIKNK
jgi:hypothetical protein